MWKPLTVLPCLVSLVGACATTGHAPAQVMARVAGEAPISGFAREFVTGHPIPGATIVVLETGRQFRTDADGKYAFSYPVGARMTLQLHKPLFEPLQTDTVIVPADGLTGAHDQITFQALPVPEYKLLQSAIGMRPDPAMCHLATTIAAQGKTMDDDLQGEPGAQLIIDPPAALPAFYFSVFRDRGPLANRTNPFERSLQAASRDGGAAFFNLPASDELYTLSAVKDGVRFSSTLVWCRAGSFINVSPPRGPTVLY